MHCNLQDRMNAMRADWLPAATDWFIQAGNVSMSAIADASKAFMVGGIGGRVYGCSANESEWRLAA